MANESVSEKLAKMHAHIYKINGQFYLIGQWTLSEFKITNDRFEDYQEAIQQFDSNPNSENEMRLLERYKKFKRIGDNDYEAEAKIKSLIESLDQEELNALEKQVADNVRIFKHFYDQGYFHN